MPEKKKLIAAIRTTAAHVKTLDESAFAALLAKATPKSLSSLLESMAEVEEESSC